MINNTNRKQKFCNSHNCTGIQNYKNNRNSSNRKVKIEKLKPESPDRKTQARKFKPKNLSRKAQARKLKPKNSSRKAQTEKDPISRFKRND